jgi:hypothetical protein
MATCHNIPAHATIARRRLRKQNMHGIRLSPAQTTIA